MSQNLRKLMGRVGSVGLVTAAIVAVISAPARAEDLKGRWYFGGNLSFLSSTDNIRSNAQIIIGPAGDDGIPFTGDPNEEQGCTSQASQSFCDPRPDDLLARENSIQETFKYDFTAGFGLTSWLSLQLDASYFKGSVGPVDVFIRQSYPISNNPLDPTQLNVFKDSEASYPITAGDLTEMPVTLSAVARFRKDSPMNPYIGIGGGMIFAHIDTAGDVGSLNQRIGNMHITGAANEFNKDIVPNQFAQNKAAGEVPFLWPLAVEVSDAFEWHLMGGAEYFFNDKFSMVFDARYSFGDQDVMMFLGNQDQIDLTIFPEQLFRPDGTLKIFRASADAPNPLCSDTNYLGVGCDPVLRPPGQRVNPVFGTGATKPCPKVGDFDANGSADDVCYPSNINPSPKGSDSARGDVVAQGGSLRLTGFSVGLGLRFHW